MRYTTEDLHEDGNSVTVGDIVDLCTVDAADDGTGPGFRGRRTADIRNSTRDSEGRCTFPDS